MIIIINYNSQDDYKDNDDGDDDEEEEDKDACVKSSCSLNEVPEPSVAGPLMLLLVKSTMAVIAVMSVVNGNYDVDNNDDDKGVEKDEVCLTLEKRREFSLAKSLEGVEQTKALNKKIAEKHDCLQHLSQSGSCTPGQPQKAWPPELFL